MRGLRLVPLLLVLVAAALSCQQVDTLYAQAEEVEFDPQEEFDGVLTHEISVIKRGTDPLNPANYILMATLPEGVFSYFVDIFTIDLKGVWFVAVRGIDTLDGDIEYSEYAYSFIEDDVDTAGTFGFINRTSGQKPGELRVTGGP